MSDSLSPRAPFTILQQMMSACITPKANTQRLFPIFTSPRQTITISDDDDEVQFVAVVKGTPHAEKAQKMKNKKRLSKSLEQNDVIVEVSTATITEDVLSLEQKDVICEVSTATVTDEILTESEHVIAERERASLREKWKHLNLDVVDVVITREQRQFRSVVRATRKAEPALKRIKKGKRKEYEVEKILYIGNDAKSCVYVKWWGWPYKSATWETRQNIDNCTELIREYRRRMQLNDIIAAMLAKTERGEYPDVYSSPAFIKCHEWEDQLNAICRRDNVAALYVENWVDEEGEPADFTFSNKNLILPDTAATFEPPDWQNCECVGNCASPNGCCPELHNSKNFYTSANRVIKSYRPEHIFLLECSDECKCDISCPTRVVQRGRQCPLVIFRTLNKGWGVRAATRIKKNTFVTEYVGKIVTEAYVETHQLDTTYLFDIDGAGEANKYVVDATHFGNEARFINHSCEPNLRVLSVVVERYDRLYQRLAFFSLRDIARGEELTLDYLRHGTDDGDEEKKHEGALRKCMCGANKCKGYYV